jgi:hypothetical protein
MAAVETKSSEWSDEQIAKLGFLVGRGKTAKQIAIDMQLSETAVYKRAHRFGLRFRDVPNEIVVNLPPAEFASLVARAAQYRLSVTEASTKVLSVCAVEPYMMGNIIDE